jgi:hypothetical protein
LDILYVIENNPFHPDNFNVYIDIDKSSSNYSLAHFNYLLLEEMGFRDILKAESFYACHVYLNNIVHFLKKEFPKYCSLLHILAIAMIDQKKVFAMLTLNDRTFGYSQALKSALERRDHQEMLHQSIRSIDQREVPDLLGFEIETKTNAGDIKKMITLTIPYFKDIAFTSAPPVRSTRDSVIDLGGVFYSRIIDLVQKLDPALQNSQLQSSVLNDVRKQAFQMVTRCAQTACIMKRDLEYKIFPSHFWRGTRIVSPLGEALYEGITIDQSTGEVSGKPDLDAPLGKY